MNQILSLNPQSPGATPVGAFASPSAELSVARLAEGFDLAAGEAETLFGELVEGRLSDPLMAAAFVALRLKGETAAELTGAARALRAAARPFPSPDYLFADSCGTGGDQSGSINVSTAAGLVAAACGLPVVKHGNRSFTSRCGSADVLEALGARLDVSPERSRAILDETGFCFLLAPAYHPGIAHAGPVRRALKVRTVMNLLGPCLNPARPPVQLLGVSEPALLVPVAKTLRALGVRRALVVHGSGLDEIALHGFTQAVRMTEGLLEGVELTPEQFRLERRSADQIRGGTPADNAERLRALLSGRGGDADIDIVAANAGALLHTAGIAFSLADGAAMALDAMRTAAAARLLTAFVEASHA